jgi:hypothetical protein
VLAEHTSYSSTGVMGLLGCTVGLVLGFPSLFRALKARDGTPAPGIRAQRGSDLDARANLRS